MVTKIQPRKMLFMTVLGALLSAGVATGCATPLPNGDSTGTPTGTAGATTTPGGSTAVTLHALVGKVTTLAGGGQNTSSSPVESRIVGPRGVAVDAAGNVYVADRDATAIRKITPAGVVTTLAGGGDRSDAGSQGFKDGTGAGAIFIQPNAVAVDGSGTVYVIDGNTIRKITPAGVVTTLAGSGAAGFGSKDGTGADAQFGNPEGLTVDGGGNIYVADTLNGAVRKVTPTGVVTTQVGKDKGIKGPNSVAVDATGNIYVGNGGVIRLVTSAGVVSTVAGGGSGRGGEKTTGYKDGTGTGALFNGYKGITLDSAGNLYVADTKNNAIRKVTSAGVVTTVAGGVPGPGDFPGASGLVDGTGSEARFTEPVGVTVDGAGNLYVADIGRHLIRKIE